MVHLWLPCEQINGKSNKFIVDIKFSVDVNIILTKDITICENLLSINILLWFMYFVIVHHRHGCKYIVCVICFPIMVTESCIVIPTSLTIWILCYMYDAITLVILIFVKAAYLKVRPICLYSLFFFSYSFHYLLTGVWCPSPGSFCSWALLSLTSWASPVQCQTLCILELVFSS